MPVGTWAKEISDWFYAEGCIRQRRLSWYAMESCSRFSSSFSPPLRNFFHHDASSLLEGGDVLACAVLIFEGTATG